MVDGVNFGRSANEAPQRLADDSGALFAQEVRKSRRAVWGGGAGSQAPLIRIASAEPQAASASADPRQTFHAAFAAMNAEGAAPSPAAAETAKEAAAGLVQSAIREGRPEYISQARADLGEAEFDRRFQSVGLSAPYARLSERILTAGRAGDTKALDAVKAEVNEAIKQGDLHYANANAPLMPLWHAADAVQRNIAAGRPFDDGSLARARGGVGPLDRWVRGAGEPAHPGKPGMLETAMAVPFAMVEGPVRLVSGAAGDMQALHDGPVSAGEGLVYARTGPDGEDQLLYRNPVNGEYVWFNARDPEHTLGERGTFTTLASALMGGGGPVPRGALAANGVRRGAAGEAGGAEAAGAEAAAKAKSESLAQSQGAAPTYSGGLVQTQNVDNKADLLAQRIGGSARVHFKNDPRQREFDAVSDKYVAQTEAGGEKNPGKRARESFKATFQAAVESGRQPYFHFEQPPSQTLLNHIQRYEQRYGITAVIDTTPF